MLLAEVDVTVTGDVNTVVVFTNVSVTVDARFRAVLARFINVSVTVNTLPTMGVDMVSVLVTGIESVDVMLSVVETMIIGLAVVDEITTETLIVVRVVLLMLIGSRFITEIDGGAGKVEYNVSVTVSVVC